MNISDITPQFITRPSSELLSSFLGQGNQKFSRFYIGSGAFVMKDRCIPMEAVSSVMVKETPDAPLVQAIVFLVFGFLIYRGSGSIGYYGNPVIAVIGIIFIVCGIITLVSALLLLMGKRYMLRVNVNNGQWVEYSTKKAGFPEKVLAAFCQCVEDRNACFVVDFQKSTIRQEPRKDAAMMFRQINNYYGGAKVTHIDNSNNSGIIVNGDGNSNISQTVNGLTEKEWESLRAFFEEQSRIAADAAVRLKCKELEEKAKQKDGKGLVRMLEAAGKTVAQAIISTLTEYGLKGLMVALFQAVK